MTEAQEVPLVFECSQERLVGILHLPRGAEGQGAAKRLPGVLIVVGGPQYRAGSHRQFVLMARDLAQAGYPVFRFDYRGMGDSDGAPHSFEQVSEDIRCAIDAFAAQANPDGVILWGLCDAASACLMYASQDARVRALIAANPWVRTQSGEASAYIKHYYGRRLLQRSFWLKALKGELKLLDSLGDFVRKLARSAARGAGTQAPQSFIERMRRGLQEFHGAMLVLMSENDLTAQEFRELYRSNDTWSRLMGRLNVEVFDLDGADHTFSSRESLSHATRRCIEWLDAHSGRRAAA